MNKRLRWSITLLIILMIGVGLLNFNATRGQQESQFELFSPLFRAYDYLRNYFYHPELDRQQLLHGAIRGMLKELDDPYSRFMAPQEYEEMRTRIEGEFGGLGIKIAIRDEQLIVIAPIKGTPAYQAGVKAGDIILEIDGISTEGMDLSEAVQVLRGDPGTPVTLTVTHRDGTDEILAIVRDIIEIQTVESERLEGEIGYIRINSFNDRTAAELDKAFAELPRIQGIVLDLRDNPGGLLSAAIEVSSRFIDQGWIVSTKSPTTADQVYHTRGNELPNFPLAVLINQGSASASEIVAGAIQDHRMGILVGARSFGKGLIQTTFRLGDGSAIALTTAEYYTPNGSRVQDVGLTPDIPVESGDGGEVEGGEDQVLNTAVAWVKEHLGQRMPLLLSGTS